MFTFLYYDKGDLFFMDYDGLLVVQFISMLNECKKDACSDLKILRDQKWISITTQQYGGERTFPYKDVT